MIEILRRFLEMAKKQYKFNKETIATGGSVLSVKRKNVKAALSSFNSTSDYLEGYEDGTIIKGLKELKIEYGLTQERVGSLREQLSTIYDSIKMGNRLTEDQYDIVKMLTRFLNELKTKLSYNVEEERTSLIEDKVFISKISRLIESLEMGKEIIDSEDFKIIDKIVSFGVLSPEENKELYIKTSQMNLGKIKRTPLKIPDLKYLLSEYEYQGDLREFSEEEQEEIRNKSDVQNMMDILSFMSDSEILNKFSIDSLISILLYGNINFMKEIYSKLKNKGLLGNQFYYYPSIWIRSEVETEDLYKSSKEYSGSFYSLTKGPSLEETLLNQDFLKEQGYNVSQENESALRVRNKLLKYNLTYASICGLKQNNLSNQFSLNGLDSLIDNYIEQEAIGLILDSFPSELYELKESFLLRIWTLMKNDPSGYKQKIFTLKDGKKVVKEDFVSSIKELGENGVIDEAESAGLILPDIPNRELYDMVIEDLESTPIDESYYELDAIKVLDQKNKMSPTTYVFGSNKTGVQIVSRPKVLRIFGALIKSGEVDDEKEALLYALTYNSILDKEAYELIKRSIGYTDKKSLTY